MLIEVVWITCGLLWCFCLGSHSDGTHSLQSKWCNVVFLQICSTDETNSSTSWMAWRWVNVKQENFIFRLTIPLRLKNLKFEKSVFLKLCTWSVVYWTALHYIWIKNLSSDTYWKHKRKGFALTQKSTGESTDLSFSPLYLLWKW